MPQCPKCTGEMTERTAKKSGKKFWGCKGFPNCDGVIWENKKSERVVKEVSPYPDPSDIPMTADDTLPDIKSLKEVSRSPFDLKICAFNSASLIISRYIVVNQDLDLTAIKESTETVYKYFLEVLSK